ncbi:MAG: alpha/beta fold hydrolase [Candidatus Nanopelagicales bacterium]
MTSLPALLLLHGLGDDGACWGPFVDHLRHSEGLATLQVRAPDAPAHGGRIAAPGQSLAWPDLVADAVANAEDLVARSGRPIVCAGHSMGSIVALGVTATRPDLVAATFLEDPPLGSGPPPGVDPDPSAPIELTEFREWFTELQAMPLDQLVAQARAEHPTWDAAEYEPWARAKQSVDLAAFADPVVFIHCAIAQLLREAQPPVVVVAGDPGLGGTLSTTAGDELADQPGWTVHRLPTGHDVRRDDPQAAADLLADLLRTVAT